MQQAYITETSRKENIFWPIREEIPRSRRYCWVVIQRGWLGFYHTIRYEILTVCLKANVEVSLIYRTVPETKKNKWRKIKAKNGYSWNVDSNDQHSVKSVRRGKRVNNWKNVWKS